MNLNLSLGKWFGVPVILHWSWVLIFAITLISNPSFAVVYVGVFFLVLLHELGHSMAGRYFQFPTKNITLYPFGGVANMQIPAGPRQEMFVAMAGPAVNLVLFPVFVMLQQCDFFRLLGYYNLALFIFNVIPAFPMDGGRVLRAILSITLRDHYRATLIAARIGQGFCVLFGVVGIMTGIYMLVVIAMFIWLAASGEIEMAKWQSVALSDAVSGREVSDSAKALGEIEERLAKFDRNRSRR